MRASKNKSSSGSKREPQSQGVYTYLGAKIFDLRPFLSTGLFRDKNIPLSTHDQILWPLCSQSLFFVWELSLRRKGCSVNGPDLSSQPGSHLEHHHEGLCRSLRGHRRRHSHTGSLKGGLKSLLARDRNPLSERIALKLSCMRSDSIQVALSLSALTDTNMYSLAIFIRTHNFHVTTMYL